MPISSTDVHEGLIALQKDRQKRFSSEIIELAEKRLQAIKNNDYFLADQLNGHINKLGCCVVDSPNSFILIALPKQDRAKDKIIYSKYVIEIADVISAATYSKQQAVIDYYSNVLKERGIIINVDQKDFTYTLKTKKPKLKA